MNEKSGFRRIVSIHDVMPDTLEETRQILSVLRQHQVANVQLLIVPGLNWSDEQIETLKAWQDEGHELVGHGWHHQAKEIKGLWHRLHSLLISRNVAEHLALSEAGVIALLADNHRWFETNGLQPPSAYVPPAWALGALTKASLDKQPFASIETLSGLLYCPSGMRERQYLIGFEADTWLRMMSLKLFNAWNLWMARLRGKALRVSIHPYDLTYRLAHDIERYVAAQAS